MKLESISIPILANVWVVICNCPPPGLMSRWKAFMEFESSTTELLVMHGSYLRKRGRRQHTSPLLFITQHFNSHCAAFANPTDQRIGESIHLFNLQHKRSNLSCNSNQSGAVLIWFDFEVCLATLVDSRILGIFYSECQTLKTCNPIGFEAQAKSKASSNFVAIIKGAFGVHDFWLILPQDVAFVCRSRLLIRDTYINSRELR